MTELPRYIPPVTIVPDFEDGRPRAMAALMRPDGEGRVFGGYRICKGLYSQYPLAHQRTLKKIGGPLVVAVYEGRVVAFYRPGLVWTSPEHRGKGLGPELGADCIEMRGGPVRHYQNNWEPKLTEQAVKLHNKIQQILAARGVVKA